MTTAAPRRLMAAFPLVLLAVVAACLAVSAQSFWIDETQTAFKAMAPTLHGWWAALYAEHNSNMQLPLYMLYVWGWARLFGVSEMGLRAANIPWFFLGLFAVFRFLRAHPRLRNATALVYCLHPFVWYYLNEARPYIAQLSGAMLATGALLAALDDPEEYRRASWWWLFVAGIVILCGSSILGIPWAVAITVFLAAQPQFRQATVRHGLPALAVCVPILTVLALYFAWTLEEKMRPGRTGMRLASLPFVFYEQFGFVGLGPGRVDMRSGGVRLFLGYLPSLCLLGAPLAYALWNAGRDRFGLAPDRLLKVCTMLFFPTAFVFGLGFVKDFLVLGRHLMPLFPFVLGATAFSVVHLWSRERTFDRIVVSLLIGALAVSALECRFAWRHEKDDNRDACALAKSQLSHGDEVWWVADPSTPVYYRLPCSFKAGPGKVQLLWRPKDAELAGMKPPALVLLSRPDLFDANHGVRDYLKLHGYAQTGALPAFSLWTKPPGESKR